MYPVGFLEIVLGICLSLQTWVMNNATLTAKTEGHVKNVL
jgi:hypothetical protein